MWSSKTFFCVQLFPAIFIFHVFQDPGFSGSRSRVRVQGLDPSFRSSSIFITGWRGVNVNFLSGDPFKYIQYLFLRVCLHSVWIFYQQWKSQFYNNQNDNSARTLEIYLFNLGNSGFLCMDNIQLGSIITKSWEKENAL